ARAKLLGVELHRRRPRGRRYAAASHDEQPRRLPPALAEVGREHAAEVVAELELAVPAVRQKTVGFVRDLRRRGPAGRVDDEHVPVVDEREVVVQQRVTDASANDARRERLRERAHEPRAAGEVVDWLFYHRSVAAQVSVIGSGAEHEGRAEAVGQLLARAGVTLVCGGRGEVMAAAARGAKSAGGTTIGILPGTSRSDANAWIDHVVLTGVGRARNLAVAASGDAVIAVGGRYGT